jgi:ABC-type lipoprotein release transport system permease subunit
VAIGATGRDLTRLVAAHSSRLVIVGLALGIGIMYGLRQIVRASGGTGSFYDAGWNAFAAPIVIVVAIAAVATWIPSRRATRINPAQLLRAT